MRLIHVFPYLNKRGGVERYMWELTRLLSSKHNVEILTSAAELDKDSPKFQVKLLPAPRLPFALTNLWFAMRGKAYWKKLKERQSTIVHVQGASAWHQDIVTAQSCHKAWFLMSLRRASPLSKSFWLKLLNPYHYVTLLTEGIQYRPRNIRRVIAISQIIKQELMHYYKIPERKISVLHSGVNTEEFDRKRNADAGKVLRQQLAIPDEAIVLSFVANEFVRKGLDVILQAMARLPEANFHLAVAGKGNPAPSRLSTPPAMFLYSQHATNRLVS